MSNTIPNKFTVTKPVSVPWSTILTHPHITHFERKVSRPDVSILITYEPQAASEGCEVTSFISFYYLFTEKPYKIFPAQQICIR